MTDVGDAAAKYRALPTALAATADAAITYFKDEFGHTGFRIEEPIHDDVSCRPTLSATTKDHQIICIEVSATAYTNNLNELVVDCQRLGLPVKAYVTMPRGVEDPSFRENSARARNSGVGIVEVDQKGGKVLLPALSLSLTSVRPIPKRDFPARYRPRLVEAEDTFRFGTPDKACAIIYEEIEAITRAAAQKALDKGVWTKAVKAGHVPAINLKKDPWRNVITAMTKHCDFKQLGCPDLSEDLLTRIAGVVTFRNQVEHKIAKVSDRVKRDTQLRTRFEGGVDLLRDLAAAARPLRL